MVEKKTKVKAAEKPAKKAPASAAKVAKPKATGKGKDAKIKKLQQKIKSKNRPMFRGRFGARSIRRVSLEKWQKWRKTRGVDVHREASDGFVVDAGYRTPKSIRGLHPSGLKEVHVTNPMELVSKPYTAVRIAAGVGKAKRKLILAKAKEMGLKVLN